VSQYQLPVLSELVNFAKIELKVNFEQTLFVCVQHLLGTTVNLFAALIELGAKPDNIYLLGKHYSQSLVATHELLQLGIQLQTISPQLKMGEFADTFAKDVKALWHSALQAIDKKSITTIIVLDDGGHCLAATPYQLISSHQLIGIEQTSAGLTHPALAKLPFPIIAVASSAAKQWLEAPIIANAVAEKVSNLIGKNNQTVGVIGVGAIGKAVITRLQKQNCKIIAYDNQRFKVDYCNKVETLEQVIQQADIIFGCTGTDIFKNLEFNRLITNHKLLISCSSEDKEFLTLLRYFQTLAKMKADYNPLANIQPTLNNKYTVKILRGGFPINFDHSKEVEPPEDIQLTRGLLLSALIQAYLHARIHNVTNQFCRVMLHPFLQHIVVKAWLENHPRGLENTQAKHFYNLDWIAEYSDGFLSTWPGMFLDNSTANPIKRFLMKGNQGRTVSSSASLLATTND
jgi:hypothetical protein